MIVNNRELGELMSLAELHDANLFADQFECSTSIAEQLAIFAVPQLVGMLMHLLFPEKLTDQKEENGNSCLNLK